MAKYVRVEKFSDVTFYEETKVSRTFLDIVTERIVLKIKRHLINGGLMVIPNLFLIGTQKGGSTSLFSYLKQHPDITPLAKNKEPNIFCAETEDEANKRLSKLSCEGNNSKYYLDGSVNYSRYPRFSSSARNIYNICDAEGLKLIYILRNPVNRLISNYFWNADNYGESRSLELAIQSEEQYVKTSLYDLQIEQYLQYFRIDQFYFICFENFIQSPVREVNRIFEWLELNKKEDLIAQDKKAATNKDFTRAARLPILNKLIWSYYPLRTVINRSLPQKTIRQITMLLTKDQARPEISIDLKKYLLEKYFLDSIQQTAKLTGLNLSKWLDDFR